MQKTLKRSGQVFWLFGLSGSGKTSLSAGAADVLRLRGSSVLVLDGDVLRKSLCHDLGFSDSDRTENVRRTAEIAKLASDSAIHVIVALITPQSSMRSLAREIIGADRFAEIFVDAPIEECRKRDVKGLYAKAGRGELQEFTGVSSLFERPESAALILKTAEESFEESLGRFTVFLEDRIALK